MEAKELMLEDWVYAKVQVDDTGTEPVYETIPKRVSELSRGINGIYTEDTSTFAGAEILPIPLTPEILEMNGYRNSVLVDDYYIARGVHYNVDSKCIIFGHEYGSALEVRCEYVHELQHALRLAGIKKEIIL